MSMTMTRRSVALLLMLPALFACEDPERERRRAFIGHLSKILGYPGRSLLPINASERKLFGDYSKHYDVLLTFGEALQQLARIPPDSFTTVVTTELSKMVDRLPTIASAQSDAAAQIRSFDQMLAAAHAERAGLNQPDDLKAVYDKAFAKLLVEPCVAGRDVLVAREKLMAAALEYVAYAAANRSAIGPTAAASDPATVEATRLHFQYFRVSGQHSLTAARYLRLLAGSLP